LNQDGELSDFINVRKGIFEGSCHIRVSIPVELLALVLAGEDLDIRSSCLPFVDKEL
jgi:hypothetical protein